MPTVASSLNAITQTTGADATTVSATRAQATGAAGLFQTTLAEASVQASQVAQATATADTAEVPSSELSTELVDDTTDGVILDTVSDATLAAIAAQFLNPPVNAAVAQANGTAIPAASPGTISVEDIRTRADQRLLEASGGPGQAATPPANAPELSPTPTELLTAPTANTPRPTQTAVPAPDLSTEPAGPIERAARAASNVAVRGGLPNIPPPAPIVTNLLPGIVVPADLSAVEPTVTETAPVVQASGLPATDLGDRPAMAGEKFAAFASAGALLTAPPSEPPSRMFANVLEGEGSSLSVNAAAAFAAFPAFPPVEATVPPASTMPSLGASSLVLNTTGGTAVAAPVALTPNTFAESLLIGANPGQSSPTGFAAELRVPDDTAIGIANDTPNMFASAPALDRSAGSPAPVPPTAAPAAHAVTATPAAQITDSIVTHARVLERPGSIEFQMRLDPPELGRLHIRLVASGDEMHGHVLVADDTVRRMLESQLPELRQRLEAAGVNVQRFDIATDSGAGNGGNRNPYRDGAPEFAPRVPTVESPAAPRVRIGRAEAGTVDVTV